jgi:hypothetical protein
LLSFGSTKNLIPAQQIDNFSKKAIGLVHWLPKLMDHFCRTALVANNPG